MSTYRRSRAGWCGGARSAARTEPRGRLAPTCNTPAIRQYMSASVSIGQHRPASVSIGQHPSASVSSTICCHESAPWPLCTHVQYRGTSLIRNRPTLAPYSRLMSRALWWSQGGWRFLMSEVPLYTCEQAPGFASTPPRNREKCEWHGRLVLVASFMLSGYSFARLCAGATLSTARCCVWRQGQRHHPLPSEEEQLERFERRSY